MESMTTIRLHERSVKAAHLFIETGRDAHAIADELECSERTVYRIIQRPDFNEALDKLGYEGRRDFSGKKRGKYRVSYRKRQAKAIWEQMRADGVPPHKHASTLSSAVGCIPQVSRRWINQWLAEENRVDLFPDSD